MCKIFGDKETISRAKKAKPGDPIIYLNWEAIDELPDEYEAQIVKVEFDIDKDFDITGKDSYYPKASFMNVVAEKRGIRGASVSSEAIIEEVDINPLLMKPLDATPTIQKKIIGKTMTKTGYVIESDGQERPCFPCTVDFNVWERCLKAWSEEEVKTDGYNPNNRKTYPNGTVYYEYQFYNAKTRQTETAKYYPKYDTPQKRNHSFNELMLFAQRNADTKSKNVVVRTITGMHTGYTRDELKEGFFIFHRICRSREMIKLEAVANLEAIKNGNRNPARAAKQLFGPTKTKEAPPIKDVSPKQPAEKKQKIGKDISNETIKEVKEPTKEMADILIKYMTDKETKKNISDPEQLQGLIKWLKGNPDISKDSGLTFWKKAINKLKEIESGMQEFMRETHELY